MHLEDIIARARHIRSLYEDYEREITDVNGQRLKLSWDSWETLGTWQN